MKHKVLVTREVFDETLAYLAEHVEVTANQADVGWGRDELVARLQGVDAVLIQSTDRVDADLLARCPSVKAVCSASVGYNHIDVAACTRHGVMVTNTPSVLTESVADMAVCLTLATLRRVSEGERWTRTGTWPGTHLKQLLGHDLHHATVGLAGMGRIGQAVAKRLRGFDCKLLYTTRNRLDPQTEGMIDASYVTKQDLLRQSDVVILILPYSAQTHHYIGAAELAQMKPGAVLINMARGGIVDDAALAQALAARTIWAAGLDVYENEPRIHAALLPLDNVLLSPHIGSATGPTRQAMAMTAARNCVAALTTGEPPNLVNPEARGRA